MKSQTSSSSLKSIELTLRRKLKYYVKRSEQIHLYLTEKPEEWGYFQNEFNKEIDLIFNEILNFVKTHESSPQKIEKLKKLFIHRFRSIFLYGELNKRSLNKPYGYAGDFEIIDDIYQNKPGTRGFERLFDNYFLMSSISVAVRNRKDDFKRIITDFVAERGYRPIRIMNLACGPCREIKELIDEGLLNKREIIFDCYDQDINAINYAKQLLKDHPNVNFCQENALKISSSKKIKSIVQAEYDFIYSTGLFDYLNHKITTRLLRNLKLLLKPTGVVAVADVRDKYSNPSVFYMEWVGDWNLIYNEDEEFRRDFIRAGFSKEQLRFRYERQGIIQYVLASNRISDKMKFLYNT